MAATPSRRGTGPEHDNAEEAQVDGRRASRDRNLNAVVDALLDLFNEGNLRPGADEIAARSGVSRRSVFRYFDALDELNRVAIARQQARVLHLVEIAQAGQGTLEERIDRLVQQRQRLFTAIGPVARVSRLRAPFHPVLAEELEQSRRFLRRQAERQFEPELSSLSRGERSSAAAALDVLTSFETYELLVIGRGMSARQAGDVMRHGLRALFAPASRRAR
jgi:AcrR family transcriptional regulator